MYATPRHVKHVEDCLIYHTIDLPNGETIHGQWDLRESVDDYLGHVDVRGKRVLDVGTAGGFLTFALEQRGAEVVSYDMASGEQWNLVPYVRSGFCPQRRLRVVIEAAERVKDGYWYAHERLGSQARVYYGDYRRLPAELGTFDAVVVGMILPHVSDPFALLASVAALARETLIITQQAEQVISPYARWMPQATTFQPPDAWWSIGEGCISAMLSVVGFEVERVTRRGYRRAFEDRDEDCTTFVARRRAPDEVPSGTVMLSQAGTDGVRYAADHQDRVLAEQSAAVEEVTIALTESRAQVEALTEQVAQGQRTADELRASLRRANDGLAENARNLQAAQGVIDRLREVEAEADALRRSLAALRRSRTWRLAGFWWRLRARFA